MCSGQSEVETPEKPSVYAAVAAAKPPPGSGSKSKVAPGSKVVLEQV
jgi:hypothetical protein